MESGDGEESNGPSSSRVHSPHPLLETFNDDHYFAGGIRRDLDDESSYEMPALESISNSSESEGDEEIVVGDADDENNGGEGDGRGGEVSEEIVLERHALAYQPDEMLRSVANETRMGGRFSTVVGWRDERQIFSGQTQPATETSPIGNDEMATSEPSASNQSMTQSDTNMACTNVTITSSNTGTTTTRLHKRGGSSRPSDAFTTDGRGRVISFGDTATRSPVASQSPVTATAESSLQAETETETRGERRGILGWFGTLI